MNRKLIWIPIIISFIVFATLCKTDFSVDAMDNTQNSVRKEDKCPCPRGQDPLLRESINDLKEKGTLTEDDIKNIDSYMIKEREVKDKEIKEKIYNDECEKIDKMVSNKIITKEKGEKLKVEVKENLQQMKRHMKRNNK